MFRVSTADSHSDDPDLDAVEIHGRHPGVVAGPPGMSPRPLASEVAEMSPLGSRKSTAGTAMSARRRWRRPSRSRLAGANTDGYSLRNLWHNFARKK
jgi:hypothetical protein